MVFIQAMNWLIPLTISCTIVLTNTYVPQAEDEYRSMAFVFDTTGSMKDDYNQLKEHAEGIMTYVQNRNDTNIKHFVYVPFNDPGKNNKKKKKCVYDCLFRSKVEKLTSYKNVI